MERNRISFIGAGNVGSALCLGLSGIGFRIDKIVSLTPARGKELADSCGAIWSDNMIFPDSTGIIIVAVPDHELVKTLSNIECNKQTFVFHTAGSFGLDVFTDKTLNKGVFYPLQTFSAGRSYNFKEIPVFVEAANEITMRQLKDLTSSLGSPVFESDTEKRRLLHLAAVFACNFTNHMMTISKEIAGSAGFEMTILGPLIMETIAKAMNSGPEKSQTGPAIRNDRNTILKHLELLSSFPELGTIYSNISESIIKYHKK